MTPENPSREGGSSSPEPGIRVQETGSLAAETRVRDDGGSIWTAPRLHRALLDAGLDEAVRQILGSLPVDLAPTALEQVGLTPLDGRLSVLVADAARAGPASEAADRLLQDLRGLGHGRVADLPTSTADVFAGLPVLLAIREDVVPQVEVVLDEAWAERRRQYRSDTLRLLVDLAVGCRVELVATEAARDVIWHRHREEMPTSVTRPCNPRPEPAGPHDDALGAQTVARLVAEARDALDPDGPPAAICRYCADVEHAPTYGEIETALRLEDRADSYVRVAAQRLADLGLVERAQRPDGRTVLRLRTAGAAYVDAVTVQSTLGDPGASDPSAKHPPKILPPCRVLRAGTGGGDRASGGSAAEADPDAPDAGHRPAGEADAVASSAESPRSDHDHGPIDVRYLPYPAQDAALAAAEQGSVTLADAGFDGRDDPRQALVGYDDVDDQLVVSVRYTNPMQYTASTARALTSWHVWNSALENNRLGENLRGLDPFPGLNVLQDARNLGWLGFEDADGERYRDRLEGAREQLLDLLTAYRNEEYDDCDAFRGEITRFAHGLIGTMTHLLELAGVDVVLECRVPDAARHFGEGTDRHRQSLCRTLATTASIQARYGHCVLYRQLFEQRDGKIERAIAPDVDPSDPLGTLPTAIVVAGDGVEELQDDLRRWFDAPAEVRDDAPEIAADVPIRTDGSVAATREAAERTLRTKGLVPTDEAIALLHGLTRSPYAVSAALAALGDEPGRRELLLDEVRFALSYLDEDCLWRRDATPTQKAGLKILLEADEPISQAELCRRGGFSAQSWRNNRDVLLDADLIRETPAGWRLSMPFRAERSHDADDVQDDDPVASADVVDDEDEDFQAERDVDDGDRGDCRPPWYVRERSDRVGILAREQRRSLDVLLELVEARLPRESYKRLSDPDDPTGRIVQGYREDRDDLEVAVEQVLDETDLGIVWPLVVASCGVREGHEPVVDRSVMGPSLPQRTVAGT